MSYVDGYIFPCYKCGNPAGQMDAAINNLSGSGITFASKNETTAPEKRLGSTAKFGMLWIDVEGASYWSTTTSNNVNFIQGMVNEGVKRGISIGIYSSASQWSPICGTSTAFAQYPLWYPHYESPANPSFSDFKSFGGWTKPAIKQYVGTTSICSASIDKNFY
jgi:hypothetical protein